MTPRRLHIILLLLLALRVVAPCRVIREVREVTVLFVNTVNLRHRAPGEKPHARVVSEEVARVKGSCRQGRISRFAGVPVDPWEGSGGDAPPDPDRKYRYLSPSCNAFQA